jgi:Leucine-rich repeat (LRR) protein
MNSFTGKIPSFDQATELSALNLGENEFDGTIPLSLFDLPKLKDLQIHGNKMTGTIPSDISKASLLSSLALGPNLFTGSIQLSIAELTNLERLSMQGLGITGRLPASFGMTLTKLVELVISDTDVGGDIPTVYGDLVNLKTLNLSGNSLRDFIPSELGRLSKLGKFFYCCAFRFYCKSSYTSYPTLDSNLRHSRFEREHFEWFYSSRIWKAFGLEWASAE